MDPNMEQLHDFRGAKIRQWILHSSAKLLLLLLLFEKPVFETNYFHANRMTFVQFCPPSWIHHLEFLNFYSRFIISDPENPRLQNYISTRDGLKIITRRLEFRIFHFGIFISRPDYFYSYYFIRIGRHLFIFSHNT